MAAGRGTTSESSWRRIARSSSCSSAPGLDAELVDERLAGAAVGLERVGLPARRGRARASAARAARSRNGSLRDERLELGDERGVAAERELRVDPVLERSEPGSSSRTRVARERLGAEVGERRAAPERERLAEQRRRAGRVSGGEPLAPFGSQPLEARRGRARRPRPGARSRPRCVIDPVGAERLAQLRDVALERLRRRLRRATRPRAPRRAPLRRPPVSVQQQKREQRPRLRRGAAGRGVRRRPLRPVRGREIRPLLADIRTVLPGLGRRLTAGAHDPGSQPKESFR